MPKRGTPSLWPIRILTDFGKSAYVLWALAGLLFVVAIAAPGFRGTSRSLLLGLGTRLQFMFFAVLVPALVGEVLKWIVGRGRPFVGGEGNVFNFRHFGGTEAFASFPSGHANTAFALAFAVSALWPQARLCDAGVRRRDRAQPPRAAGASSERRGRRRPGRRDRRDGGALLVCRAPPRFRDPRATAPSCRFRGPRWGTSKGLPEGRQPHKKRTPPRPWRTVPAASQLKRRVLICLHLTRQKWPFPSLCPCATKPATWRR